MRRGWVRVEWYYHGELDTLVPADSTQPYDIKDVIHRLVDGM